MCCNQSDSGDAVTRKIFHRDPPARRNIAVVVDAPCADRFAGASANDHSRGRDAEVIEARDLALRSADYGFRRGIAAGRAVEDQEGIIEVDDQDIMDGIDRYRRFATCNLGLRSYENTFRRDVSLGQAVEDENAN